MPFYPCQLVAKRSAETSHSDKPRDPGLWPDCLWAALSETPSEYAKERPGTHTFTFVPHGILTDVRTATLLPVTADASLPPAELISDPVKRSSRAYTFHFHSLVCEIASVQREAPSARISVDRLAALSGIPTEKVRKEMEAVLRGRTYHPNGSGQCPGHFVSFDAGERAMKCLKLGAGLA